MHQTLIFTVLPTGVVSTNQGFFLSFSVHIAPRLESSTGDPTKLVKYPDWSDQRTWPDTINALKSSFRLHLQASGLNKKYDAKIVGSAPDADRFSTIFPSTTPVTPYKYKGMEHRKIRSAPVGSVVDLITALYGKYGLSSPVAFPQYSDLAAPGSFGPIGFEQQVSEAGTVGRTQIGDGVPRRRRLTAKLEQVLDNGRAVPYDLAPIANSMHPAIIGAETSLAFLEHQRFFQRGLPAKRKSVDLERPSWDFHQMVAGLNSLPTLLRVLGFVLDMEVGPVASADLQHGFVQASLELDPLRFKLATALIQPLTYSRLTKAEFLPAAKNAAKSDHDGMMLKVGNPKLYRLIRVDHDNAVAKSLQFANTVTRSRKLGKKLTLTTPDRYSLPALKTGGFAISRSGRAVQMAAVLARQTADLEGGGAHPQLYLDDVVRGHRFDVFDVADGIWRSLMWRTGDITIDGATTLPKVLEEDAVVPSPTTASSEDADGDLYLQETLTRWDGWSLAVPRIGKPFQGAGPTNGTSGSKGFSVTTKWAVPTDTNATKLPRMRFGRSYRMRARAVDLAGNSLTVEAAPTSGDVVTGAVKHLRFEPVPAPRALLVDAPLPGASEEIVVIRSESATVDSISALDNGETVRLLVPAPTSVSMVEHHGVLDEAGTTGHPLKDAAAVYNLLVTRDQHSVEDDRINPDPKVLTTAPALYPGFLPVNYLPEVLGRIALVRGLPINSNKKRVASLNFDTAGHGWPKLQAVRIKLSRGANNWSVAQVSDPNNTANVTSELDLTLDKGDMITTLVNCHIDENVVPFMALWEWIELYATAHGKDPANVLKQIVAGEHWMFTPWREVTFVHAVRTPLLDPQLFLIPTKTAIGQTFAEFPGLANASAGTVLMSRKSTARIDVDGTWSMPIDTGTNDDPVTPQDFAGHAFSIEVGRVGEGIVPGNRTGVVKSPNADNFAAQHEFNDTKFRAVTYRATATSFYVEYFREELQLPVPSGTDPVTWLKQAQRQPGVAFEESTVRLVLSWTVTEHNKTLRRTRTLVQAPVGTDPATGDPTLGDYVVFPDPSNGTDGSVQMLAKSSVDSSQLADPEITFSYVAPTIHTYSDPVADKTTEMMVRNSKRPDAPDVLYVVPIYHRVPGENQVTRQGGALRVYMNRPWWSSGANERLGVVCWHKSAQSTAELPPKQLLPYVTVWGYDPAFKTHRSLPGQPSPANFPLHTATGTNMPIEEVTEKVDVAGHNVGYDTDRKLWYCDIRVTATSGKELTAYMPFVRFAFARFQTHSITGAHLSKVVVADYAQLAPNRSVTMTGSGSKRTLTVVGRAPVRTNSSDEPSAMRVLIEKRDGRILDDDLAWSVLHNSDGTLNETELTASVSDSDLVTWTGKITVPANNGRDLRLTFEEFERMPGALGFGRLVFTETLPLVTVVTG
jgi:hypothetical protein